VHKVELNNAEWADGQWDVHQFDHCKMNGHRLFRNENESD